MIYLCLIIIICVKVSDAIDVQHRTAKVGSNVLLSCKAKNATWLKGSKQEKVLAGSRHLILGRIGLIITNVTASDQDFYTCFRGPKKVSQVQFTILAKPKIKGEQFGLMTKREHTNVTLFCNVTGSPAPEIQWESWDTGKINGVPYRNESTENGIWFISMLRLNDLKPTDRDIYICTATNSVGQAYIEIELMVEHKPNFDGKSSKETFVWTDQQTTVLCNVNGFPEPTIVWYKNGTRIDENSPFISSTQTKEEDYGEYTNTLTTVNIDFDNIDEVVGDYICYASNNLGSSSQIFTLTKAVLIEDLTDTINISNQTEDGDKETLVDTPETKIFRIDFDVSDEKDDKLLISKGPKFVDFDPITQQIVWTQLDKASRRTSIMMTNVTSEESKALIVVESDRPGVALDWLEKTIFFTESTTRKINKVGVQSFELETVTKSIGTPKAIALDTFHSVVYWVVRADGCSTIQSSTYDGSAMIPIKVAYSDISYIAVDYESGRIYFVNQQEESIEEISLDGLHRRVIVITNANGLSIRGNYVYYKKRKSIIQMNKTSEFRSRIYFESSEEFDGFTVAKTQQEEDTDFEDLNCPEFERCLGAENGWMCLQKNMICDAKTHCYGKIDEINCCHSTHNCSIDELDLSCNRSSENILYDSHALDFVNLSSNQIFHDPQFILECSLAAKYMDANSFQRNLKIKKLEKHHVLRQFAGKSLLKNIHKTKKLSLTGKAPTFSTKEIQSFDDLQELKLHKTELETIDTGSFRIFFNLKYLTISENPFLLNIMKEAFAGLNNLRILRILKNKLLCMIDRNAFFGLGNMQLLTISGNSNLSQISSHAFAGLQSLTNVTYSGTKQKKLTLSGNFKDSFTLHSDTLEVLDLRESKLQTISQNFLYGLEKLQSLKIIENLHISALTENVFHDLSNLRILNIAENSVLKNISENAFNGLDNLLYLTISGNKMLSSIHGSNFEKLANLQNLTLSNNTQLILRKDDLSHLTSLKSMNILDTGIKHFASNLFHDLKNVEFLNISGNGLETLHEGLLHNLLKLLVIDLRRNHLHLTSDSFERNKELTHIYSDSYAFCCIKPRSVEEGNCFAPNNDVSSCTDLIEDRMLRMCLWEIGLVATFGNIAVLIYRFVKLKHKLKQPFSIFVMNLGVSDAVMGLYMLIIAFQDSLYEGEYVWNDYEWRHSVTCKISGIIALISSESSVMFISLITVDRFLLVKYPLGGKRIGYVHACVLSVLAWVFSLLSAIVPAVVYPEFYSKSGVCIALPLSDELTEGWQYSVALFLALNFILFIFIAMGQIFIFKEVISSTKKVRSSQNNREREVAKILFAVAVTDCLCWLPIGIMVSMGLSGLNIPRTMYAWTIVFILPVNSAINPFLYTFAPLCRNKVNEQRREKRTSSAMSTHQSHP